MQFPKKPLALQMFARKTYNRIITHGRPIFKFPSLTTFCQEPISGVIWYHLKSFGFELSGPISKKEPRTFWILFSFNPLQREKLDFRKFYFSNIFRHLKLKINPSPFSNKTKKTKIQKIVQKSFFLQRVRTHNVNTSKILKNSLFRG